MTLTPDDDRISAYLDGELSPDERVAFEAELSRAPEVQRLVEELGGMKRQVHKLPSVGISVNLAPEILSRLKAYTPTPGDSTNLALRTEPAKPVHSLSSRSQVTKTSWYSHSFRTLATLVGTVAMVTVAVGLTFLWQAEQDHRVSSSKLQLEKSPAVAFDMTMSDDGVAAEISRSRGVPEIAMSKAAPEGDLLSTTASPSVVAGNLALAYANLESLSNASQLNQTRKWAETMASPQGAIVQNELPSQQVLTNLMIQNSNPTSEIFPIEIYCESVSDTARTIASSLSTNGIVLQNSIDDVEAKMATSLADNTSPYKMSVAEQKQETSPGAGMKRMGPAATTMDQQENTESLTFSANADQPASAAPASGADASSLLNNSGEYAVYVDASPDQVVNFLIDTEQRHDVSKMMINNLEPVYVVDSNSPPNATNFFGGRFNNNLQTAPAPANGPAKPQSTGVGNYGGNALYEQPNRSLTQESESVSPKAAEPSVDNRFAQSGLNGRASWMELQASTPFSLYDRTNDFGTQNLQQQRRSYQFVPSVVSNAKTVEDEKQSRSKLMSARPAETPTPASKPAVVTNETRGSGLGGASPSVQTPPKDMPAPIAQNSDFTRPEQASPSLSPQSWRVLLILRPLSDLDNQSPPPPPMPTEGD